VLKSAEI